MGRVSHIECSLAYHSKLDLYKYGSKSVNVDRVPNCSKEIPIDKPAAGTIWCKTVYSYNYNGEDRIFVERNSKTYKNFKRDVFYRNAPVEIRIVKKTNEVYAPAAKNKVSYILLIVLYLILEVALTVGIILLIRMDV